MPAEPTPAEELYAKLSALEPRELRFAASILLLRDAPDGMEVLMVVRNKEIEFASGAMVFPGGRLMESDHPDHMSERIVGQTLYDTDEASLRVAAIREAFEEVGLLPSAQATDGDAQDSHIAPIDHLRAAVDREEADFAETLRQAGLTLDISKLVRLAHIIAPKITPKRFNTHFYAVGASVGQSPRPDGKEIMEAIWITPMDAIAIGERGERQVMFPTRMVLRRLGQFASVAETLADALKYPPQAIEPKVELRNGVVGLSTMDVPGFPASWEDIDAVTNGRKNFRVSDTTVPAS